MSDNEKKLNVGKESVVMGDVSGNVGDRSVVVGPTDNKGNVVLNQPMAVGYNAHAGPGSIAIGAYAGAGSDIAVVFSEIEKIILASNDRELISSFTELCNQIANPKKNKSKITKLWDIVKMSATLNGAANLVSKAAAYIGSIIEGA